jgi:hypothetical protein
MDFLAHGAHGRGRTRDSIKAISEQQQDIRERLKALEASSSTSLHRSVPPAHILKSSLFLLLCLCVVNVL